MNLVLQMLSGISVAALAESMALADRAGLRPQDVLDILELTNTASPLLLEKGNGLYYSCLHQSKMTSNYKNYKYSFSYD